MQNCRGVRDTGESDHDSAIAAKIRADISAVPGSIVCGIAGFWGALAAAPDADARLASMTTALAHRGPDGQSQWRDDNAGLGHTRLAIIDLEGGHQPMHSANGHTVVVFNGEIYNYRELKARLEQRGYVFRTRSDTEVIWAALDAWGLDEGLLSLRGMFGLALYNVRTPSLAAGPRPGRHQAVVLGGNAGQRALRIRTQGAPRFWRAVASNRPHRRPRLPRTRLPDHAGDVLEGHPDARARHLARSHAGKDSAWALLAMGAAGGLTTRPEPGGGGHPSNAHGCGARPSGLRRAGRCVPVRGARLFAAGQAHQPGAAGRPADLQRRVRRRRVRRERGRAHRGGAVRHRPPRVARRQSGRRSPALRSDSRPVRRAVRRQFVHPGVLDLPRDAAAREGGALGRRRRRSAGRLPAVSACPPPAVARAVERRDDAAGPPHAPGPASGDPRTTGRESVAVRASATHRPPLRPAVVLSRRTSVRRCINTTSLRWPRPLGRPRLGSGNRWATRRRIRRSC